MPDYEYKCPECGAVRSINRPLGKAPRFLVCDCSKGNSHYVKMRRCYGKPEVLWRDKPCNTKFEVIGDEYKDDDTHPNDF